MIKRLGKEYDMLTHEFDTAREEMREVMRSVGARLEAQGEEREARLSVLDEICHDPSASTTAKRLAELEAQKLRTPSLASEEELQLFFSAYARATQAIDALNDTRSRVKEALQMEDDLIKNIRKATLGDPSEVLRARWIKGDAAEFKKLCREDAYNEIFRNSIA